MKSTTKEYRLITGKTPITHTIATKQTGNKMLQWWDDDKQMQRTLRYATNHPSIFVDEQPTEGVRLGRVFFDTGMLLVPDKSRTLQKFLAHHPDNKANGGGIFELIDPKATAKKDTEYLDLSFEAQRISRELSLREATAVMRNVIGNKVDSMYSEEITRDVRIYAERNPADFMKMIDTTDVPEIEVNNDIQEILRAGLIQFRKDDSEVYYNLPNKKKMLFRVPANEEPMEALQDYLINDKEGLEKFKELLDVLEN